MLSSIHPLGERAKGNRFALTAAAHIAGAALGGALMGSVLGAAGGLVVPERSAFVAVVAAAVCLGALLADALATPVPSWRRQVNEDWLTEYRGTVYGFGFGVQLGMGLVTIVTSAVTYAAFACALLVASLPGGAAIGAAFGVVRGLVLLSAARLDSPARLRTFHRRLASRAPVATRAARLALSASAAGLVIVGVAA